jgi:hypothetical protein
MKNKMYKLRTAVIITLANLLISISIFAQAPQKMSYQAVIRDANNNLVTNHAVGIRVSILRGSATGTLSYREIYNPDPQTNANGLVTIEIGSGIALTGSIDTINWAKGTYYISVETDPTGATSYTITGTSQLLSVPYALYSGSAANGFSGNYNDLTNKPTFATVATSGSYNDLSNQPTIPATQVNSDWNSNSGLSQILNKPTLFSGAYSDLTGAPTLATIATSGSYNDLTNKPTTDGSETKVTAGANIKITGSGTVASPYIINDSIHKIGDSYGGGIVFFLYDNGRHGLIAATADQSTNSMRWSAGTNTNTMAHADGVSAGKTNTAIIIANQGYGDGATYAARVCTEYSVTVGGVTYGDWYLPSKYELNLLYQQKSLVGGFASAWYWSSTEDDTNDAWTVFLGSYGQTYGGKASTWSVRAIRAF